MIKCSICKRDLNMTWEKWTVDKMGEFCHFKCKNKQKIDNLKKEIATSWGMEVKKIDWKSLKEYLK